VSISDSHKQGLGRRKYNLKDVIISEPRHEASVEVSLRVNYLSDVTRAESLVLHTSVVVRRSQSSAHNSHLSFVSRTRHPLSGLDKDFTNNITLIQTSQTTLRLTQLCPTVCARFLGDRPHVLTRDPSDLSRCPPAHHSSFRYTGSSKPFGPENPVGFTQNTSLYISHIAVLQIHPHTSASKSY